MLDNREIHIIILVVVLVIICYMSRKEKFEIEHTRTSNSTIKHGEKYLGIIGNRLGLEDKVVYFNLSSDLKKGNKNIFYNLDDGTIELSNTYPRIVGPHYIKLMFDNEGRIYGILADFDPKTYYLKIDDFDVNLTDKIIESTVFSIKNE